jgi:muramoyltetrapeptide carboxypeptidase
VRPRKPRVLQPGDTIGIVSPSWFGGETYVPRAMRGIATLESLGYNVKVAPHAFNNRGSVSDTAVNRAADLHAMFADPGVSAIICTIGGNHSCHLLPLIDWNLIARNPKIFMGSSDITVLNNAIWSRTGLATFNGPSLMTDWAEYPSMPALSRDSALAVLTCPEPPGALPVASEWTDEFLDWETGEDLTRRRVHRPASGPRWIRPGDATGTLVGGCLESLQHLRGTPWWPDMTGAILFIETSEDCAGPEAVDAMLMDYQNMGVFDAIAGLLVARPYGMDDETAEEFWRVIDARTARFSFPVVGDLDFGHTSPQMTVPVGVPARIDGSRRSVELIDAAVSPSSKLHDNRR